MEEISKIWLTGRFNPDERADFSEVPLEICDEAGHYLHLDALKAWIDLNDAAKKAGIQLQIVSSTRNFERQKRIWENKWNGVTLTNGVNLSIVDYPSIERSTRILKYSAMPGSSRHHWGTDLDINSVEPEYFDTPEGIKVYDWLNVHAENFGFAQPYTAKGMKRRFGYEEEKWHWSYLPLSIKLTAAYPKLVSYDDYFGFDGAETAESMQVIDHFVLGISKTCLPSELWQKNV
jgi:LAS superfamily LD-carboxypeptidase LdcB